MGHRAGLHVLAPEEPSRQPSFGRLAAIGGVFAGIVIAGIVARTGIKLAKGAGDVAKGLAEQFVDAWTGGRS